MVVVSVLIIIVAALLALVVLAQNPKGGGLAAGFTVAQQIGGVQRTADFLEKGTWTLAGALMVLCLVIMLVMVFGNVILRLFFNTGIDLSEEIPRVAFVWMTFLGAIGGTIARRVWTVFLMAPSSFLVNVTITVMKNGNNPAAKIANKNEPNKSFVVQCLLGK